MRDIVSAARARNIHLIAAVTPIAGHFVPERVVIAEFPSAEAALDFYISDRYAPLLQIRLATTVARLVIMARSGELPPSVRAKSAAYLQRRG